ncbi:MAG: hypothetical protein L6R37_003025 [Teloschistes peruensis]|nr:MAG: hypothetical protein L6R37_003025 [Teloschistes peruensis]
MGGPGKAKSRDGRQSRSRNTTPSSNISIPISSNTQSHTAYLQTDMGKLMVPANITYEQLLNQHGGGQGIPDPTSLNQMVDNLKTLGQLAEGRSVACDKGMRELSRRREERVEEEHRLEQENRDREEKASLKRAADEEEARGRKTLKTKKVKKERSIAREERPLAVGAHGLARQDGLDLPPQANPRLQTAEEEFRAIQQAARASIRHADKLSEPTGPMEVSPSSLNRKLHAASTSSLSSASQPPSPIIRSLTDELKSPQRSRASSKGSVASHQPPPAASIAQYQTFGPDPTTFNDPTIYHIRPVTDEMTDEEKAEIYSVAKFPKNDVSHLIAGQPPDKDFSNTKPSNQVNANTFQAYIEPYLRPLTEEDMAFLKERGDRTRPFVMPPRGKRHYSELWAEEDGQFSLDSNPQGVDRLPPNQPRGNLEQMTDDIAETEQISNGPMLNRLLSTMRFENRPSPSDDRTPASMNGDVPMTNGITNGETNGVTDQNDDSSQNAFKLPSTTLAPATYMPESSQSSWRSASNNIRIDAASIDDRLKLELRYIGFLSEDSGEPDYDAHYDDEAAERLRTLQEELRRVSLENGARKARILELAKERMAYQEYSTIREDLDTQVQQAYLKRNRTLSKTKKNPKKPGGAGGGSHLVNGGMGGGADVGISKPGIGEPVRQLMNRRQKWVDMIGPVFEDGEGEEGLNLEHKPTIFDAASMERLIKAEKERWEEEGGG